MVLRNRKGLSTNFWKENIGILLENSEVLEKSCRQNKICHVETFIDIGLMQKFYGWIFQQSKVLRFLKSYAKVLRVNYCSKVTIDFLYNFSS